MRQRIREKTTLQPYVQDIHPRAGTLSFLFQWICNYLHNLELCLWDQLILPRLLPFQLMYMYIPTCATQSGIKGTTCEAGNVCSLPYRQNKTQVFPLVNKCSKHRAAQNGRVLLPARLFLQQLCEPCSSLFFYVRFNGMFCVENKTSQKPLISYRKPARKCW